MCCGWLSLRWLNSRAGVEMFWWRKWPVLEYQLKWHSSRHNSPFRELANTAKKHQVHKQYSRTNLLARPAYLVAFNSGPLFQSSQHDDCRRTLFPNHPPEIRKGLWQGTLGGDVGVGLSVPVTVVAVDIIWPSNSICRLKHHPWVVVGNHVGIPVLRLVHLYDKST